MPWKATDELKERTKFVLEWERRWNEAVRTIESNVPETFVGELLEPCSHVICVDKNGFIKWKRRNVFVRSALKYEYIEIDHNHDRDDHRPERGLLVPRRPRGSKEVSRMSFRGA
jgi:hypothetical protein